jgi:hypothetical protein
MEEEDTIIDIYFSRVCEEKRNYARDLNCPASEINCPPQPALCWSSF